MEKITNEINGSSIIHVNLFLTRVPIINSPYLEFFNGREKLDIAAGGYERGRLLYFPTR